MIRIRKREHKTQNKNERFREGVKLWAGFYRANIAIFCIHYLGVSLFPYQVILLTMMEHVQAYTYIASRGQGKSFIVALYVCAKAILYPNIKILVSCETKNQSRILIKEKIEKELMGLSPNLRREIKEVKTGINESVVKFKNGSTIEAINASDSTRGYRCQVLVVENLPSYK